MRNRRTIISLRFIDFVAHEGSIRTVEAIPGSVATWELRPDERGDEKWRFLVIEAADRSFISVNGWRVEGFDVLYEFAGSVVDAPGSLEPMEVRPLGEVEG